MRKINLSKKMTTLRGEPITVEEPERGVTNRIVQEIKTYKVNSADGLLEKFNEWQKALRGTKKTELTVRDYLLTLLSSRFQLDDKKEAFWTTALGIEFSDEKKKETEISDDKAIFLKKILERNKIKQQLPMGGEKEIDVFLPYELGQLLAIFENEKEEKQT